MMTRSPARKIALAATLVYGLAVCALALGHFLSAGRSPDPFVTIPVSRWLMPLEVFLGVVPAVVAVWFFAMRMRPGMVRKLAVGLTATLGVAWGLGLVEWLWMEQWRTAHFYGVPLPGFVHEPKVVMWAIFANAAVVATAWVVWAGRSLRPIWRNLVISLAYVPLWQFSVFALEEIALAGSTEVLWLYRLREILGTLGTVGLFIIGLGWVIWFVERASRHYALRRQDQVDALPAAEVPQRLGGDEAVSIYRVKFGVTIAAGVVLAVAAFLPFIQIEVLDLGTLGFHLAILPKFVFLAAGLAAVVLMHYRMARAVWIPAVMSLGMLVWMLVETWRGFAGDSAVAVLDPRLFLSALSWGCWTVMVGLSLLLLSASMPVAVLPDATGRVVWNPLDMEAWYYGRKSKKLVQSLSAFVVYSMYFFAGLTLFALIGGCEERYEMPAGGGEQKQMMQQVKIQKVIKKRYVINPFSAIIFNPPPIDDVKLQLLEETRHQYKVGYGAGEGAGFSGGTARGKVRFIRLEYAGGDWNQDFGIGADVNMLVEYHARTSHRVANRTESRKVAQLNNFPAGAAPPFVYMTGQRSISLSKSEIRILREYLLEKHGMIFGDNGGSSHFHNQFFRMMNQVLPSVQPVRVPLDDPIHRRPYPIPFLPYVAPHGGKDAWGWKVDGRWVCYYHPGDIGDAWTDEHAGVKPEIAEYCYQLGVNVIFYAHVEYNKWLDARKKR